MEIKFALILLALLALTVIPPCYGALDQSPAAVERWFQQLPHAKERLTKLNFFIHDIMTGDHPTTVPVAQANMTAASPTRFGLVYAMDSPLTVGPELDSKIIGRCQGTFAFVSQQDIGLLLTVNFVFTDGAYNGSTLSILGPKKNGNQYREYPIIGGSGVFRLAEGIAVDNTYTGPVAAGARPPTQCQVIVKHYAEPDFGEGIYDN